MVTNRCIMRMMCRLEPGLEVVERTAKTQCLLLERQVVSDSVSNISISRFGKERLGFFTFKTFGYVPRIWALYVVHAGLPFYTKV